MLRVPLKFHFVFGLKPQREPFHLAHYLCLKSCLMVNQPEQMVFHYHYEPYGPYWEAIKPHLTMKRVELESFVIGSHCYDETQEGTFIKQMQLDYAHQSDFIRLKALLEEGGVYADIDTLFVNPLPPHLFEHSFVLGDEGRVEAEPGQEAHPSLCNAFIVSEPQAVFGRFWLDLMYRVFDGTWSRHSCETPARLQQQIPHTIWVAPQRYFYKHLWTREGIATLLEKLDSNFHEVYSMHLWAHLWWDEGRRDFSNFHSGLLTEEHIRTVDTTYNVVARRFLS